MSAPEMSQIGPNGATKAMKIPDNGAHLSQVETGIQGGRSNKRYNTLLIR